VETSVFTNTADVNTCHAPAEGTYSPSWADRLIIIILILIIISIIILIMSGSSKTHAR